MNRLLGAIELGGTKVFAAVARNPMAPLRSARIPTEDPGTTLEAVKRFFAEAEGEFGPIAGIGIGAFGPVDIRKHSATYGRVGGTPKPGWEGTNLLSELSGIGAPMVLDTDVNAAALGEARWGAGRGFGSIVYLTVGTGIGGGIVIDGRPVHGLLHPEIGHVRLERHPEDAAPSVCAHHQNCAEGLASGPAIAARIGKTLQELGPDHPVPAMLADYLGQLCATLVLVVSPERIIIGGGVMTESGLHERVQEAMLRSLNGYQVPDIPEGGPFIVPPGLGHGAGLAGAFALAQDLAESTS